MSIRSRARRRSTPTKTKDTREIVLLGQIQDGDEGKLRPPTDFELELMLYESEALTEEEYNSMNDEEFFLWQKKAEKIVKERMSNNSKGLKKARVMTRPKANTLDPQGVVVKKNLEKIGIKHLKKISIGRYIEIELDNAPREDVENNIQEAIDKLLYNSIIEDYEVIYE
tara:strand:+ start:269 stop:775 length:507 start_codon:yes stop_codon:yes gene_type:complete